MKGGKAKTPKSKIEKQNKLNHQNTQKNWLLKMGKEEWLKVMQGNYI